MSIKCTLGGFAERARATSEEGRLPQSKNVKGGVRVLRRPVIRPDVQLLRLAIVAEGGD